jgi:hypothetical protein
VYDIVDNIDEYYCVIKIRPDLYYNKLDISLLDKDIFFPFSHQGDDKKNTNQLFFGGKPKYMKLILNYFNNII